jgi:ubiquinone/menaquinone biosynthesis C-methylase UbiE
VTPSTTPAPGTELVALGSGAMFDRIAARYDAMNRVLSFGLDRGWRRRAVRALRLGDRPRVLDLATGTGDLAIAIAKEGAAKVIGVDPSQGMLAVGHRKVQALGLEGRVDLRVGDAQRLELEDASVDAVFVGEAFHWFDAPAAVPEIARVLRPRGGLALIGNQWWDTEPPLSEPAHELLRAPYVRSGRAGTVETWPEAFRGSPFEPLRDETFDAELIVDADRLLDMYATTSSLAVLPEAERTTLLAQVRPLLEESYRLPICVELTWTRLA